MRVRMLKLAAGPDGVRLGGKEYDLEAAEARALIAAGAAVAATGEAVGAEAKPADAAEPEQPADGAEPEQPAAPPEEKPEPPRGKRKG